MFYRKLKWSPAIFARLHCKDSSFHQVKTKTRKTVKSHQFLNKRTMSSVSDLSQYSLPNSTDLVFLDCASAFNGLNSRERRFSHYLSQASWYGGLVCLYQCSPESPGIFLLLQKLFRPENSISDLKQLATSLDISDDEFTAFLIYVAGFYGNLGNYKSFGDTKFIPVISKEKLGRLIEASPANKVDPLVGDIWTKVKDRMYELSSKTQQMGLGEKGLTTYFSANCDTRDAEIAQEFLNAKELSPYNTRLFKCSDDHYEVRLASSKVSGVKDAGDHEAMSLLGVHMFTPKGFSQPIKFSVTRGDYTDLMTVLVQNLEQAKEFVANDTESAMLNEYIRSFTDGSIDAHKDGSRHWIKNKGPIIETYIGFIESYRDPFGVRGEFEGFVACVNKEMSKKFSDLVAKAEEFLPLLPWPSSYEKDEFLRPDFTSLDVLTFGSSGIPAGINIPNYDDIRQSEGFKNVSLGNVLSSGYKDSKDKVTFLEEADKDLYTKLKAASFEVQVGLHELLGHGSGKLFVKKKDGSLNFDQDKVTHLISGEKIQSWYTEGETWDSKFSTISSSYEECRAECVGIYLCLSQDILKVFGYEGDAAADIMYVNWLNMVRAGVLALEFFTPESNKWRQAHMQARYVILRVLLEAGQGLVSVETMKNSTDGKPDLLVKLDRNKLNTVGKEAIGNFLAKLQVFKSIGDYPSAKMLYEGYSDVLDSKQPDFLSIRSIVMDRKMPRKIFVQGNTKLVGDSVELCNYPASVEGMIQSFQHRFPSTVDKSLESLWQRDATFFPS